MEDELLEFFDGVWLFVEKEREFCRYIVRFCNGVLLVIIKIGMFSGGYVKMYIQLFISLVKNGLYFKKKYIVLNIDVFFMMIYYQIVFVLCMYVILLFQ